MRSSRSATNGRRNAAFDEILRLGASDCCRGLVFLLPTALAPGATSRPAARLAFDATGGIGFAAAFGFDLAVDLGLAATFGFGLEATPAFGLVVDFGFVLAIVCAFGLALAVGAGLTAVLSLALGFVPAVTFGFTADFGLAFGFVPAVTFGFAAGFGFTVRLTGVVFDTCLASDFVVPSGDLAPLTVDVRFVDDLDAAAVGLICALGPVAVLGFAFDLVLALARLPALFGAPAVRVV